MKASTADFSGWMGGRSLLADGAWATTCQERGLPEGCLSDTWNVEAPDEVAAIAAAYAASPIDLLSTNTFNANRFRIPELAPEELDQLNRRGAAIVQAAARPHQRVYGVLGPSGLDVADPRFCTPEQGDAFIAQADALLAGGADALGLETMLSVAEAAFLVATLKAAFDVAVLCAFTYRETSAGHRTLCGAPPEAAAEAVLNAGADVVGVNCCGGPEDALAVVRACRPVCGDTPLWASPNAGVPQWHGGKQVYPIGPEAFADWVKALQAAGATIVGGCCGVGPDYTARWR